ncbi:MAG: aspartate/glutamate racemase family protein, partial [Porticoccaceae bacterium]|nr:aspartate/glutamate racemase family protein [Porticoccaceae bacterium]
MTLEPPKILVFDSGVGGLSILAELRRALPQCQLFFACDNAAFPYGTKDEQTLTERVDRVLKALIRRTQPDIVVVACNSASTLVLPQIRSHFRRPV